MTDTLANLQRKLGSASDLQSVVRTMKAIAASSVTQYQESAHALTDYYRTIEQGLSVCLRETKLQTLTPDRKNSNLKKTPITAIVFGSDQGLVGQFNELIAEYAIKELGADARQTKIWTVGERVNSRMSESKIPIERLFSVPSSVKGITALVGEILLEFEGHGTNGKFYLFYNETKSGTVYEATSKLLLPIDETWRSQLLKSPWPNTSTPQIFGNGVLEALIREYLFISLFRACAESLASENTSRLAAMQRADKNIKELSERLRQSFNQLRQSRIDEELFDVVSGFETLRSDL